MFSEKNNSIYKKNKGEEKFILHIASINSTWANPKEEWGNFQLVGDRLISLYYDKSCFGCDSISTTYVPYKLFFECRDINNPRKTKVKGVVFMPSLELLNLPDSLQFKLYSNLYYDFLPYKKSLLLIILNEGKLYTYKAADIENICANNWIYKNTYDLDIDTEYFVAHQKKGSDAIVLLFENQENVTLDLQTSKVRKKESAKANADFLIIDKESDAYYPVSKETAEALLHAKNPRKYFTKKIK